MKALGILLLGLMFLFVLFGCNLSIKIRNKNSTPTSFAVYSSF